MEESKKITPSHPRGRRRKLAAPVGGVYTLLLLLGIAAFAVLCVQFTRGLLDNSQEKEAFKKVIAPVVMFDPVPFEKAADADPLFLLQSSLWSAVLGDKRESYQFNAMDRLVVPASDVDVACARLFGPDVALQHQSFGDFEVQYVYDESTKSYLVPVKLQSGQYTPSVEQVVKKGDVYTLRVGYILPTNAWAQAQIDEKNGLVPDKEMFYELLRVKDHFQVTAIRDVPKDEASSAAANAAVGSVPAMVPDAQEASDDGYAVSLPDPDRDETEPAAKADGPSSERDDESEDESASEEEESSDDGDSSGEDSSEDDSSSEDESEA